MYVSIDRARSAGLHIEITRDEDGKKHLQIQPKLSIDLETLHPLMDELRDKCEIKGADAAGLFDNISSLIHHVTVWNALKGLDESEA